MNRWFNTCYLCGYIIECYSKIALHSFLGYRMGRIKSFKHNLPSLAGEINTYLTSLSVGGRIPSQYIIDLYSECPTIMNGSEAWNPIKKYENDLAFWRKLTAEKYYEEANKVMTVILEMEISGVI